MWIIWIPASESLVNLSLSSAIPIWLLFSVNLKDFCFLFFGKGQIYLCNDAFLTVQKDLIFRRSHLENRFKSGRNHCAEKLKSWVGSFERGVKGDYKTLRRNLANFLELPQGRNHVAKVPLGSVKLISVSPRIADNTCLGGRRSFRLVDVCWQIS